VGYAGQPTRDYKMCTADIHRENCLRYGTGQVASSSNLLSILSPFVHPFEFIVGPHGTFEINIPE